MMLLKNNAAFEVRANTIMQKKIYDDICLYTTLLQREKNFSCDIEYRIIRELIQEAIRFPYQRSAILYSFDFGFFNFVLENLKTVIILKRYSKILLNMVHDKHFELCILYFKKDENDYPNLKFENFLSFLYLYFI